MPPVLIWGRADERPGPPVGAVRVRGTLPDPVGVEDEQAGLAWPHWRSGLIRRAGGIGASATRVAEARRWGW